MCGDATNPEDVAALMDEAEADLWLSDPPYNVAYEGSNGLTIENDNMSDSNFREFLRTAFDNVHEHMKPGASFYIFHADSEGYNFRGACHDIGLKVRQCLVWKKNSLVLGRQDYQWIHEPCLYGWKDGAAHNWYTDRSQTTVIEFDKPKRNDVHPTMKPVEMLIYLLKNSSERGNTVIDTFGGSGSTLIACEQTGRVCRTMELDPKYTDVIRKRWAEFKYGDGCDWQSLTPLPSQ
jgi:site-specific DNA-methyltransferase (adenine-specific)